MSGLTLMYPVDPYKVQLNYSEKVLEAIEKGLNALLESPTGTGKTLGLLCPTVAWLVQ